MEEMAKPAIEALKSGELKFVPERFGQDLSALAGEYPRLVYFQTALVGPPDSGLLLRRLRRDRGGKGDAEDVPEVRRHPFYTG